MPSAFKWVTYAVGRAPRPRLRPGRRGHDPSAAPAAGPPAGAAAGGSGPRGPQSSAATFAAAIDLALAPPTPGGLVGAGRLGRRPAQRRRRGPFPRTDRTVLLERTAAARACGGRAQRRRRPLAGTGTGAWATGRVAPRPGGAGCPVERAVWLFGRPEPLRGGAGSHSGRALPGDPATGSARRLPGPSQCPCRSIPVRRRRGSSAAPTRSSRTAPRGRGGLGCPPSGRLVAPACRAERGGAGRLAPADPGPQSRGHRRIRAAEPNRRLGPWSADGRSASASKLRGVTPGSFSGGARSRRLPLGGTAPAGCAGLGSCRPQGITDTANDHPLTPLAGVARWRGSLAWLAGVARWHRSVAPRRRRGLGPHVEAARPSRSLAIPNNLDPGIGPSARGAA
jgi:hypothetical protein